MAHTQILKQLETLPRTQSLAITFEGYLTQALVRSQHPPLLACLQLSRVPQSPLSLGKTCGGGRLESQNKDFGAVSQMDSTRV